MPNIPRQETVRLKLYVGDVGAQAKQSTTGAKCGFTLAEVLITLSIIGVIAALTIPSLVVKNQEKEAIVQLKKTYNAFSKAFTLAKLEYGEFDSLSTIEGKNLELAKTYRDILVSQLNIIKKCDGPEKGCFVDRYYKKIDSTDHSNYNTHPYTAKSIFADGSSFLVTPFSGSCSQNHGEGPLANCCAHINVDVNGFNPPNMISKDMFAFHLTKSGIIPLGTKGDIESLETSCRASGGFGCTAWALLKENMDYPPAGTGWDGQTTSAP